MPDKKYTAYLFYLAGEDLQVFDVTPATVTHWDKSGSSRPAVVMAKVENMRRVGHEELQKVFGELGKKTRNNIKQKLEEIKAILPGDEPKGQVH